VVVVHFSDWFDEVVLRSAVDVAVDWQLVDVLPGVTWVCTLSDESVPTTVIFIKTGSAAKQAAELPNAARKRMAAMFFKQIPFVQERCIPTARPKDIAD